MYDTETYKNKSISRLINKFDVGPACQKKIFHHSQQDDFLYLFSQANDIIRLKLNGWFI